jgi:hypothetical protein
MSCSILAIRGGAPNLGDQMVFLDLGDEGRGSILGYLEDVIKAPAPFQAIGGGDRILDNLGDEGRLYWLRSPSTFMKLYLEKHYKNYKNT